MGSSNFYLIWTWNLDAHLSTCFAACSSQGGDPSAIVKLWKSMANLKRSITWRSTLTSSSLWLLDFADLCGSPELILCDSFQLFIYFLMKCGRSFSSSLCLRPFGGGGSVIWLYSATISVVALWASFLLFLVRITRCWQFWWCRDVRLEFGWHWAWAGWRDPHDPPVSKMLV